MLQSAYEFECHNIFSIIWIGARRTIEFEVEPCGETSSGFADVEKDWKGCEDKKSLLERPMLRCRHVLVPRKHFLLMKTDGNALFSECCILTERIRTDEGTALHTSRCWKAFLTGAEGSLDA